MEGGQKKEHIRNKDGGLKSMDSYSHWEMIVYNKWSEESFKDLGRFWGGFGFFLPLRFLRQSLRRNQTESEVKEARLERGTDFV